MQTKNVHFSERPESVIVTTVGRKATIDFPVGITEVEKEDGMEYVAETVYTMSTIATPRLKERIDANYEEWLNIAKQPVKQAPEMYDIIEAINALTDLIIGG